MERPINPHRDRLAARLRSLRAATGHSGNSFATAVGWRQSKVSKLENGRQLPSDDDLEAWLAATDQAARGELAALLAAARVEYAAWRGVVRTAGGLAAHQAEIARLEASATSIGEYQPALVPGLVQTADYAAAALGLPSGPAGAAPPASEEVDAVVASRMRRQEILYQPGRAVRIVLGEAALWAHPGGRDIQLGQLGKLETVASLPAVELGVVPLRGMPVLPLSGFRIYDDAVAVVETLGGEQQLDDPDDVAGYGKALGLLLDAARMGDDAVTAVRAVRDELRRGEGYGAE